MITTTLAVYENGVLRPVQALPFADGETVQLTVTRPDASGLPRSPEEAQRRMREAKTLQDVFTAAAAVAEEDVGYDLLRALDENRQGERPLYPPEMKGISW
jgi:predicted DNA-binding antitoxin AbrB/MazE fold protein